MKRAWLILALVLTPAVVVGVLTATGCYDKPPPCTPGSIEWPRCDSTQPKAAGADAGLDRR